MISNGHKTSILIPSQLPEFIRDDPSYANFVAFLQAYYEWMEEDGNVTDLSKNLLSYKDIDTTTTKFLDYFTNDFLPYFPQDALISKDKAVKVARQLYHAKGTPASYKFLFRILYNSDFDVFYTKDSVFKTSDGTWYVAKSLKLATLDPNFLSINNYRIFGETTKSIATVENSVKSTTKTEIFISNIERLFQSGEFIRVVDNANQDVYFKDGKQVPKGTTGAETLRAKIVGQLSSIKIDPNNRGLLYQLGDPVIVYGGLNSVNGHGALASVANTTAGQILTLDIANQGYGYSDSPNTIINFTYANGASAVVGSLNPAANGVANIAFVPLDSIDLKQHYPIGNGVWNGISGSPGNYHFANVINANANTTLAEAFTFLNMSTYPISSVLLESRGGGITKTPLVVADARYLNDANNYAELTKLGILAPIQIANGGKGYQANDVIVFTGGSGYGANAFVSNVDSNGAITSVTYRTTGIYPTGGMSYNNLSLPVLSVVSANIYASNASLYVPGILGTGATFSLTTDRVGSISTINLIDPGEDYVAKPNVSLKVEDIVVSGLIVSNLPQFGDIVYQGVDINTATYLATVNNASVLQANGDPLQSLYNLRVFEYNSVPNVTKPLKISKKTITMTMANTPFNSNYNSNGVRIYGNGLASANAAFLNGLVVSQGQYLDRRGQPSSYSVLQNLEYNNFTYKITVEQEISKYRDILLNLLHPSGMQMLGRYALKSETKFKRSAYTDFTQS